MTHKKLVGGLAVLVAAVMASAVPRAEVIEQVLFKVNGEIFTKTDLETAQVNKLRDQGQNIDLKTEAGNDQLKKLLDQVTPQILVDAVNTMLVVQRGRELGYKLTDDQFKNVVDSIRKQNHLDTDAQFQEALKQEDLTQDQLRANIERSMIYQRVQQNEVMSKIAMTDAEARAYYDSHLKEFTTPASVTLREVVVAAPSDARGVNVAADETALMKAEDVRKRAMSGESFEKLVSEISVSPSKSNGGLIGPISVADLSPQMRMMIGAMKVGDLTQPLRAPAGYQILKLESRTDDTVLPFEQAKERISERVFTDKRKAEFEKYLAMLRSQAIIEWKNEDIHKAYEEGLKQEASAAATPTSASAAPSAPQ